MEEKEYKLTTGTLRYNGENGWGESQPGVFFHYGPDQHDTMHFSIEEACALIADFAEAINNSIREFN